MADKTELIRQRMALKREALRQKLDALEDRTLGIVKETTDAVVQVAETVEDTVQSAKKAVSKTVRKSAHMLDVSRQVDHHPWAMVGGAVAAGFFASWLVSRGTSRPGPTTEMTTGMSGSSREPPVYYSATEPYAADKPQYATPSEPATERGSQSNWLSGLMQTFAPTLDTLKHLAIGTGMAVARDMVLQAVPPQLSGQLNEVFKDLTQRLGGDELPEPDLETHSQAQSRQTDQPASETTQPRWEQDRAGEPRQGKKRPHGNGRQHELKR